MIADRYHIHNVEVQTMYLQPETSLSRSSGKV
jgi:hypothetical protein